MKTEHKTIGIFILLELFLTGLGMGVPIFLIIFGFFVGLLIPKLSKRKTLKNYLRHSILTSGFTFLIMLMIWSPMILNISDKTFNFAEFGIPLILFEPFASYIAWIFLMILISPFLQFLMTIFGIYVKLTINSK